MNSWDLLAVEVEAGVGRARNHNTPNLISSSRPILIFSGDILIKNRSSLTGLGARVRRPRMGEVGGEARSSQ